MYCPNCNQFNDDRNSFCAFCGAPLRTRQNEAPDSGSYTPPFGAPDSGSYQPPVQPPYQPPVNELTKPITAATPAVAMILSILCFNVIGLVFAVLSLVNFNNYISEKNRGALDNAETYKRKAKTFAIIADVVTAVIFVLRCIILAGIVALFVLNYGGSGPVEIPFDFNGMPQDFFGMIG